VLALYGVAYTNFARQSMTGYWIFLAPTFGIICVFTDAGYSFGRGRICNVSRVRGGRKHMMSDDASSLMVLTVLALGTFTA